MALVQRKLLSLLLSSLTFLLIVSVQTATAEEEELRVVALFKNAAMVEYAGKQKLYRVGQNLSPDIKLIKADTHLATFVVNGKQVELGLDKPFGFHAGDTEAANATPNSKSAQILRNSFGMYMTAGFINGVGVQFLVDTGASQVAMNESVAKRVGLLYKMYGTKIGVSTAAGVVGAWRVTLNKVRVGGIELPNVDALVVEGAGPSEVLLGMSFLNRVKMIDNGQLLKLVKKY
ncbi:retropepsin-like aspartic protease family protein [Aliikangiella coralliicola]|uniref:TIGR02281 family clan AA aspartic protease n=1 Tax=Aliikangiella coralliicola TaxID=2592383 RepID=A0A545U729_9GAMM|nr:TIGR02281 family clan AA aspartic protease [Aliikangiella coralliicola]TQV85291.1 TIGR02281 family clan AA aspartic protease [Aliikangiella coralliicola]